MGDMPDRIWADPQHTGDPTYGYWTTVQPDYSDPDDAAIRPYLAATHARDIADRLVEALKKAGDYIGALPGTDDAIKALEEIRSLLAEIDAERGPQ